MWIENPYIKVIPLVAAPHSPFAGTCRRAPSWRFAVAPERCSPVIGCKYGSIQKSLHTSDKRLAARSLISLLFIDGKPPLGQDKTCSTENWVPHSHSMEMREGSQPYFKHRASRKALLCRVNPNSATGRAVNQLEAPLSWASAMERWRVLENDRLRWPAASDCCERLSLWTSF